MHGWHIVVDENRIWIGRVTNNAVALIKRLPEIGFRQTTLLQHNEARDIIRRWHRFITIPKSKHSMSGVNMEGRTIQAAWASWVSLLQHNQIFKIPVLVNSSPSMSHTDDKLTHPYVGRAMNSKRKSHDLSEYTPSAQSDSKRGGVINSKSYIENTDFQYAGFAVRYGRKILFRSSSLVLPKRTAFRCRPAPGTVTQRTCLYYYIFGTYTQHWQHDLHTTQSTDWYWERQAYLVRLNWRGHIIHKL